MHATQQQQRAQRAEQGPAHVRLRVPDVSLGPQEGIGGLVGQQRHPPLDQLVEGAQAETKRHDEKVAPASGIEDTKANDKFTRDHRGYEPLG